ncbi:MULTISPECIES: isoprenyl transferase [Fusobacterium]|uniref:Isoprenyl transferase n=2 Tax=Fusobacterium varium TaxID=856 RepID=A0ABN5JFC8_FUSVA|nr:MULTISPECIES: isoprenyl transferase [Fusobacterium]AVQ30690.1 isoprenyl transferase [Fusobacterium varium ATCC 27725]EES65249.1 di-trans,poly-cis-decaprenylcistransferase [Fusobacterium varium ATCC 27725]MCF0171125.1 isoprenyl transferase [Fusobacterium varium]MCF2673899.1 isoprenyl transferase [Fusobacterium varium]MCI6033584.1 isoprenyl transferase [Fusobacterium varium]
MGSRIPNHIAIIMDGNGRWAEKRGLPRTFGHKEGADALRKIITYAGKIGVKYLTVYAFSTENWKRSKDEIDALMFLFKTYLKNEEKNIMKNNVRFLVSGRKNGVSSSLLEAIKKLEDKSRDNTGLTLNIAFNYGGRAEIIDAVNSILKSGADNINEEDFSKYLYNDIPDPELLIRTSGEFRISNFLLWQIAYSEIYITKALWPDFDEKELDKAIQSYNERDRRFGGVKNA